MAKEAPIQHAAEYLFFRAFRRLALERPIAEVRRFGHQLGRMGFKLLGGQRKLALNNLAKVFPELDAAENERIARACFELYGAQFCETIACGRLSPEEIDSHFEIEGWEIAEQLQRERGGFFLTTGHYGAAEIALQPLGQRLKPFYAVGRPLDNPHIDAAIRRIRERGGVEMIDKAGASHRMLTAFRRGGHVAIILDQHVRPSAGIRVPFLGLPAWTSPVLAILSTRTGAPVLPFTCVPRGEDRYHLSFRQPIFPEGRGPEAEAELTRRYLAVVEEDIRRAPEGWLWMHRRWREL